MTIRCSDESQPSMTEVVGLYRSLASSSAELVLSDLDPNTEAARHIAALGDPRIRYELTPARQPLVVS
jgi:hypothetical protein